MPMALKTPLTTRHKSVAGRNLAGNTLVPIAESIANAISPLKDQDGQDLDNLAVSRFRTPRATRPDHITNNSLRYLQSGKLEKESIRDYISGSRKLLQASLTREERKRDLSQVSDQY